LWREKRRTAPSLHTPGLGQGLGGPAGEAGGDSGAAFLGEAAGVVLLLRQASRTLRGRSSGGGTLGGAGCAPRGRGAAAEGRMRGSDRIDRPHPPTHTHTRAAEHARQRPPPPRPSTHFSALSMLSAGANGDWAAAAAAASAGWKSTVSGAPPALPLPPRAEPPPAPPALPAAAWERRRSAAGPAPVLPLLVGEAERRLGLVASGAGYLFSISRSSVSSAAHGHGTSGHRAGQAVSWVLPTGRGAGPGRHAPQAGPAPRESGLGCPPAA
jgi:hypothetical protein